MTSSDLDLRLMRFRSRGDEQPKALAQALMAAGRTEDALEVIHLAQVGQEVDAELATLEGRAFYEQGELHEAQAALVRAAKANPDDKEPYRWLAQVLIERGDPVRAVQVLERGLAIDPRDGGLRNAHQRAQRLAERAARRGHSSPPGPQRTPSEPPRAARAVAAPRAANHNGLSALAAVARGSRQEAVATDLLREPARSPSLREESALPSLLFDEEVERDDEMPTKAVEVPRSWFDSDAPPPRLPSPGDDDDEDAEPTSIVPAAQELELLRYQAELEAAERREAEREAAERQRAEREALQRQRAEREAAQRQRAERESAQRQRAEREALQRQRAELEAAEQRAAFEEAERQRFAYEEAERQRFAYEQAERQRFAYEDSELHRAAFEEAEQRALQGDSEQDRTIIEDGSALREVLAQPGEAEPPEEVLGLLERQGVFEPAHAAPATWATDAEVPKPTGRITRALTLAWLIAVGGAVGAYYGFDAWLLRRRESAVGLVAEAATAVLDGQYESLLEAESKLLDARSADPKSSAVLDALLFVQVVRALDGAAEELAPVRETLARAQQAGLETPLVTFARTMVAQPLDAVTAETAVLQVVDDPEAEPRLLYLAGRLAERAGRVELSGPLFERAAEREPQLAVALLASAEKARGEGRLDEARALFQRALGKDGKNLRAELWLALLDAGTGDGKALLGKLDALAPRVERGSAAERLVAIGGRMLGLLANGDTARAKIEAREAAALRASAPEPLALVAEQAARAGETDVARGAATAASQAAGGAPRYRTLLASVMLQQGAGDAALKALGEATGGDASLTVVRANAALLSDARDTLQQAKRELAAYRATPEGKSDAEAASLLMRVDMRLGANAESLLPAARALVQRAPETVAAHLALGEALVRAEHGAEALAALEAVRRLAPGSAEVHYLVAGAESVAGRFKEARAELEQAVAIAPNHREARRSLGRLLLDLGDYDAALKAFRALDGDAAKLGAAEALLGAGQVDAANTELAGLADRTAAGAVALRARVELARGRAQAAADLLAPLAGEQAEARTPELVALYGEALLQSGKADAAALAFDAALELDDAHPEALLGRAAAALQLDKADAAMALVQRADTALGRHARPPRTHARLLILQGRAELAKGALGPAREHLGRAAAMAEAPPEAHFFHGEVLARVRDPGAAQAYAKYLKLEPNGAYVARAKRALAAP